MKPHSGRLIHVGINFLTIPTSSISNQTSIQFQQAIIAQGLEFQRLERAESQLVVLRETPSPLQIRVGPPDPGNPQFGQVLIIAENPNTPFDLFLKETEAALEAFNDVWGAPNRQIIHCDGNIRMLYETTSQHAFQELWEKRLGQPAQALGAFGRPIRGGGLRFVMDPLPDEADPTQIEVKIESFLMDTSKIFVETVFTWRALSTPGVPFNARGRLEQMNHYVDKEVSSFISGGA